MNNKIPGEVFFIRKQIKQCMKEIFTNKKDKVLDMGCGDNPFYKDVIKGKSINSLFTVFAPYDNPEISMTILIEGSASNQGLAIRAAYNTLKWYFER